MGVTVTVREDFPKPKGWGQRHTLVLLGFLSLAVSYAMRFNLSLAIVAMVADDIVPKNVSDADKTPVKVLSCGHLISHAPPVNFTNAGNEGGTGLTNILIPDKVLFNWTEAEQGVILGSFFYGYFITQIPGGLLAQRYSAKWVLGLGVFIPAIFTILSPPAAMLGKEYLIVCRIIEGLAGGAVVPSIQVILAKWLPPEERSKYVSCVFSGISIGTAITMVVTGLLIEYSGWPMVFYATGAFTILWFFAWMYFVYDTPDQHPRISVAEKEFIKSSIGPSATKVKLPTPWLKMFTSIPVLVIFLAQTTKVWGLYTLLNLLPKYMKSVLHFDIKQNSLTSASPQVCMFLIATSVTSLGDFLIESKRISILNMRKLCNTLAQWGSGLAMLGAAFSGCNRVMAVIFLNFAVGFMGAGFGGCLVNVIDIAPNFAGVLMGIGNTFGSMTGFVAPGIAGWILSDNVTLARWRIVFFIAAGLLFFGNLMYIIFAQTDEVPWNRPPAGLEESPTPTPTPEPEADEGEEDDVVPDTPKPHHRHGARRESVAFVPPFLPPGKGRRYSTLSLGMPHQT